MLFLISVAWSLSLGAAQTCNFREGNYDLTWTYSPDGQYADFELSVRGLGSNAWTGLGFGPNMENGDFITIVKEDGRLSIQDRHANGYGIPPEDQQSDVELRELVEDNGGVRAVFSRRLDTRDPEDVRLWANGCQDFQFVVNGGPVWSGQIYQHRRDPIVRSFCIQGNQCQMSNSGGGGGGSSEGGGGGSSEGGGGGGGGGSSEGGGGGSSEGGGGGGGSSSSEGSHERGRFDWWW